MLAMRPFVMPILSLALVVLAGVNQLQAADLPPGYPANPPAILTADPLKAAPQDDELRKLLKPLYNERQALTLLNYKMYLRGGAHDAAKLFDDARRLMRTGLELHSKLQEKVDFLKQMQEMSKNMEDLVKARPPFKQNDAAFETLAEQDHHRAREFALEVEIALLKAKKETGGKKD